jgi:transposase
MKGQVTDMIKLRKIIQRLKSGQSIRGIFTELNIHRTIIRKIQDICMEKEWLNPDSPMPSDEEIMTAWAKGKASPPEHILDPYKEKILKWHNTEGNTAVVIQRLLRDLDSVSIDVQVVRRYLKKHTPKQIKPVMVRSAVPGKDADVDFGDIGIFEDEDKTHKKVYLFSLRLRYARKAYRELVTDQQSITFNKGHIHAFEFFGGVPSNVHPDCTKCAVIKASIENDGLNKSYQSLAEYYGFAVSPCRPYTPEHKGGVEKDMDYVKRSFVAYFRTQQKEMGIAVPKIRDLKNAFEKWQREIDDVHKIQGVDKTPNELFAEEKQYLQPLPHGRWELQTWARCTVRSDWRVIWENGYYSVPYALIGETVDLCATSVTVRIFHNGKEVALHERCKEKWEYKRKTEHAPPFQEAVMQCTREGLLRLAEDIGPHTHKYSEKILSTPGIDRLAPVRNMLKLVGVYGKERLEKACERALCFQLNSYRNVKNLLEGGLEQEPCSEPSPKKILPFGQPKYARDPNEYKRPETWDEQLERSHPVSKYGNAGLGGYYGREADELIDELIKEEEKAAAEGREGPLRGKIPKPTQAWYESHGIMTPEECQLTK